MFIMFCLFLIFLIHTDSNSDDTQHWDSLFLIVTKRGISVVAMVMESVSIRTASSRQCRTAAEKICEAFFCCCCCCCFLLTVMPRRRAARWTPCSGFLLLMIVGQKKKTRHDFHIVLSSYLCDIDFSLYTS